MPDLGQLPLSLRERARWETLAGVPALIVDPAHRVGSGTATAASSPRASEALPSAPCPMVLWMHGRTAHKEIDPGRYLRLLRAGIATVALDLPGHGERPDPGLAGAKATLQVVERMVEEIDPVLEAALASGRFDPGALAIGGFSAGGMSALVRLCRPHPFRAAVVEATTGDWSFQRAREMYDPERVERMDPVRHLESWRPIPLLILHAEHDEWVQVEGQRSFMRALIARGVPPDLIEFHAFDRTGAPGEHIGFGRFSSAAKDLGTEFLVRRLMGGRAPSESRLAGA